MHGHWIPDVFVGEDETGNPVVSKIEWVRIYMTGDPDLNARAAQQSGQPKTGQHRYPLERIRRKIIQVTELDKAIDELKVKFSPEPSQLEE